MSAPPAPASDAVPLLAFRGVHVAPRAHRPGGTGVSIRGSLENISFSLRSDEVLGVLGPARSSKSTLLRVACGLVVPSAGEVRVLGEDPSRIATEVRGRIGLAGSHDRSFHARLSARENLEFFARLHGMDRQASAVAIRASLAAMDLEAVQHAAVRTFPAGLRLRLSIARALLGDPRLLVLDEPTSGLEHGRRDRFYALLAQMIATRRLGVLWATRDMTEAQYLCTRVLLLDEGRLVRVGPYLDVEPLAESLFLRESAEQMP